jgi:hypothetical protein
MLHHNEYSSKELGIVQKERHDERSVVNALGLLDSQELKSDACPYLKVSRRRCKMDINSPKLKKLENPLKKGIDNTRLSVDIFKNLPEHRKSAIRNARNSERQSMLGLVRDDQERYAGFHREASLWTLAGFGLCTHSRASGYLGEEDVADLEDDDEYKERKWFAVFTDLIFVSVILQFSIQLYHHVKGFYIEPTKWSDGEWSQMFQPAKTYSLDHDENCTKTLLSYTNSTLLNYTYTESSRGLVIGSDGMECWNMGEQVFQISYESVLCFFSIFVMWLELSCALGRFANIDGMLDDLLYLCCVISIVFMSCYIEPYKHTMDNRGSFALLQTCFYISFLFLHILYYKRIKRSRNYAYRRIWTYSIAVLINTVFGLLDSLLKDNNNILGYWLSFSGIMLSSLVVFYVSLTGFVVQYKNNDNIIVDHFVERFGVLIMITMGESILSLIIADTYNQNYRDNVIVTLSFLLIYILKDVYFLSDVAAKFHALRVDRSANSCM